MNVIFLGPPGAGKGTQAKRVCAALDAPQISTGDMLRRAIQEQTETGMRAKAFMDAGKLVPDEVIIALVEERLKEPDCQNGYILDGFPRTVPQAEALDKIAAIDAVINLEVSDEHLVDRLSGRRVCLKCGGTYHMKHLQGETKCAVCGDELVLRDDDRAETVRCRLDVYHKQTAPLVAYYLAKGNLHTIDGAQGMDETYAAILNTLGVKA